MKYINKKLTIERVSVQNIANKYGTPTYCYSYKKLNNNINNFRATDVNMHLDYPLPACDF